VAEQKNGLPGGAFGRPRRMERLRCYRALVLLSAFYALSGCATLPEGERRALVQASDMYSRGQIASAEARLDRMIKDYDQTKEIAEAYYLRALCRIRRRQDLNAAKDFERAIQKSKRKDLSALCRASLAALAYKQGKWERAAEIYAKAIPDLPNRPPTDVILYCTGLSMQRIGKWKEAAYQFGRILRKFRDRPIASDARRMAGWKHEYYSIQFGAYKNADNAADIVRSYRKRNLDAVQEYLPRGVGSLWVVRSGIYPTYSEAQVALRSARKIESGAIIIPN